MALKATIETDIGETRELYIRLNNVEASNHGVLSHALFRGFLSEEAFRARKHYIWEQEIAFVSTVSKPLWKQAYEALKAFDPSPAIQTEIDQFEAEPPEMEELRARLVAAEVLRDGLRAAKDA